MTTHGYSTRRLGRESGRTHRSICYYLAGERPIPEVFVLGLEALAARRIVN